MGVLEIPWNPSPRQLRQFAWLLAGCLLVVAAWVFYRGQAGTLAAALAGAGLASAAIGFTCPQLIRWVYVAWMVAVFPIGWLVSHAALAVMYYLVLTPIGLLLRFFGHDPMQRRPNGGRETGWRPRQDPEDMERYFKQY